MRNGKDDICFMFDNMRIAKFWLKETTKKFIDEIVFFDEKKNIIEFPETTFYFMSKSEVSKFRSIKLDYVYNQDANYIILDDPERYREEMQKLIENFNRGCEYSGMQKTLHD